MELTVRREDLAAAAGFAARTMSAAPNVPVLAGMLLTATSDGTLTTSTFDYDITATGAAAAAVKTAGRRLVSGRMLAEIVKALPTGQDVTIADDGAHILVACGPAKFRLQTMPHEEYPDLPPMPAVCGALPAGELATAIAAAVLAAGRDDTLPVLTGVLFEPGAAGVTLYATDRYRAARCEAAWTAAGSGIPPGVLIPAAALSSLAKGMPQGGQITFGAGVGDESGDISIAGFSADGFTLVTRLVAGEFPAAVAKKFRSAAPAIEVDVGKEELAAVVNRVAIAADGSSPAVRLTFSGGHLRVRAADGEGTEASDLVDAGYGGAELEVAFNPNYLLDAIAPVIGTVRLGLTSPTEAALITQKPPEADGTKQPQASAYRCVLMPIKRN